MCMIGGKLHSVRQAARQENQVRSFDVGIDQILNIT
jgi:hypothetical protein